MELKILLVQMKKLKFLGNKDCHRCIYQAIDPNICMVLLVHTLEHRNLERRKEKENFLEYIRLDLLVLEME